MKNNRLLTLLLILALMLACNMPAGGITQEPPPPPVLATETLPIPVESPTGTSTATETLTPLPSDTPTMTPTATPSVPMVTPLDEHVNCRFGPSTRYQQVAALLIGVHAQIIARNNDSSWWQIRNPQGGNDTCWVSTVVVTTSGELASLPVVAAPAAFVTNLTINIEPDSVNQGQGCPGPAPVFSLKGTITTNGPVKVTWRFSTEKDGIVQEKTLNFDTFDTKGVAYNYTPSVWNKGNYWVRLVVISPTNMKAEANYQIRCSS